MSTKVALLVVLLTIQLTAVVSTDCDSQVRRCVVNAWISCVSLEGPCVLIPRHCRRLYEQCAGDDIGSALSKAESGSSAPEVERNASIIDAPADCESELLRCVDTSWMICRALAMPCLAVGDDCYRFSDLCEAGEIANAQLKSESSSNVSEVQHNDSTIANSTDCDSQVTRCLAMAWMNCVSLEGPCILITRDCRRLYDECRDDDDIGSARSGTYSSSSASEVERNASITETPADCDNDLKRCFGTTWMICRILGVRCAPAAYDCNRFHDLCKAGEIESARSEMESSSSASDVHHNASRSANSADCDNQVRQCVANAWISCLSFERPCLLIPRDCRRLYDQCRDDDIESTRSKVKKGSSALEVERNANITETPEDCGSELRRCLDTTSIICRTLGVPCSAAAQDCRHFYWLCNGSETESARSQAESSSSASELERSDSNSGNAEDCDSVLRICRKNRDKDCGRAMRPCPRLAHDCDRLHDQCRAAEILAENARLEKESRSSAYEVERKASISEIPVDCASRLSLCLTNFVKRCPVIYRNCSPEPWGCVRFYHRCKAAKNDGR